MELKIVLSDLDRPSMSDSTNCIMSDYYEMIREWFTPANQDEVDRPMDE